MAAESFNVTDEVEKEERNAKIEKYHNYQITKSNDFIRNARSNLTTLQSKIIAFLFSQVEPQDTEFDLIEFNIADFCDVCCIDKTGMYSYIRSALKKLRDQSVWVQRTNEKGELVEETFAWFDKVILTPGKGIAEVKISKDMRPYLLELKSNFTTYRAVEVYGFEVQYSAWFYDNFARMRKIGTWTVSLDEIRKYTMTKYAFKDLHRRVIAPAVEDINKHTTFSIKYSTEKKGRAIDKIKFYIGYKELDSQNSLYIERENQRRKFLGLENALNEGV